MTVELFFVALVKHDEPQFIVAGPFLNQCDADEDAKLRNHATRIMKTTLQLEIADWQS